MPREQPIELFMPPNMLRAKAGGGFGGIDMGAIKRAETAMETLKSEFSNMAGDDVKALGAARDLYAADPKPQTRAALARKAHDLKGHAGSFDFPLIARVAASLCKLMGESAPDQVLPAKLVNAHVSAIQVMHRQNMTGTDDKIALALIAELDAQVAETLALKK